MFLCKYQNRFIVGIGKNLPFFLGVSLIPQGFGPGFRQSLFPKSFLVVVKTLPLGKVGAPKV